MFLLLTFPANLVQKCSSVYVDLLVLEVLLFHLYFFYFTGQVLVIIKCGIHTAAADPANMSSCLEVLLTCSLPVSSAEMKMAQCVDPEYKVSPWLPSLVLCSSNWRPHGSPCLQHSCICWVLRTLSGSTFILFLVLPLSSLLQSPLPHLSSKQVSCLGLNSFPCLLCAALRETVMIYMK